MSDSLGRLVLGAQGRLATVEPLMPSRYAPGPVAASGWAEPAVYFEQRQALPLEPPQPKKAAESPVDAGEDGAVPQPPRSEHRPPISKTRDSIASSAAVRAATLAVLPEPIVSSLEPSPNTLTRQPSQDRNRSGPISATRPLRAPTDDTSEPAPRYIPTRPIDHLAPPRALAPLSVAPLASGGATNTTAPTMPLRAEAGPHATPPEIRISIGSVEVHAATSRPVPVRQSTARQPTVSLADYLSRRDGKAR